MVFTAGLISIGLTDTGAITKPHPALAIAGLKLRSNRMGWELLGIRS